MKSSKRLCLALNLAALLLGLLPLLSLLRGESPFRLGLDLAGGTRVTYRPDLESRLDWTRDLSDQQLLEATKDVLASRLGRVLATVPDVVVRSDQRLVVSVPGDQDRREVLDLVGRTYRLTFRLVEAERPGEVAADLPRYRGAALELSPPAFSGEMLEEGSIRAVPASAASELGAGATVVFELQGPHQEAFARFTEENVGRRMAILIDDDVEWVGTIESAIRGTGSLQGGYTLEEATEIALLLRSGTLPVSLEVEAVEAVTPSLGREVRDLGLEALAVAGGLLLLLVTIAYARSGWLLVNGWLALGWLLLLISGLASALALTLDMVGIAAIILSIGMGMDGFVLVFESLMARRGSGRPAKRDRSPTPASVYRLGSEGGALLHGNVTTLLVVLLLLGNERLHSFAVFVTVGIAASVLTIFLTRENLACTPGSLPGLPLDPLGFLRRARGRLFRWRWVYGLVALAAAVVLSVSAARLGSDTFRLGEDFTAGSQVVVRGDEPTVGRVVADLRQQLPEASLTRQLLADDRVEGESARENQARHLITLSQPLGTPAAPDRDPGVAGLEPAALLAAFERQGLVVESLHSIDGKVSARRLGSSLRVMVVSFLLLAIYFAFLQERVEKLLSSSPPRGVPRSVRSWVLLGILVALALDLLFVGATMAGLGIALNLPVVGALLSIVGYSVNDSVVLWSHVRRRWTASRDEAPRPTAREVVSRSVDEILSRAVLTSASTLAPVIAILVVGVAPLRDFAVVLAVGTIAGTFSSLFVVGSFGAAALERTRLGADRASVLGDRRLAARLGGP